MSVYRDLNGEPWARPVAATEAAESLPLDIRFATPARAEKTWRRIAATCGVMTLLALAVAALTI